MLTRDSAVFYLICCSSYKSPTSPLSKKVLELFPLAGECYRKVQKYLGCECTREIKNVGKYVTVIHISTCAAPVCGDMRKDEGMLIDYGIYTGWNICPYLNG